MAKVTETNVGLKVIVLISTFNGEKYLHKQLESIANQAEVTVVVYANDDGSSDGTLQILEAWQRNGLIKSVNQTKRLGSTQAFLGMLRNCDDEPFIAFCDQDDIWDSRKLITQIQSCQSGIPSMVFSKRSYINSIGGSFKNKKCISVTPSFGNALVENVAPGNTILINSLAVKVLNSYSSPEVPHFDSWIYLVISAFGNCCYVNTALVAYRIHEDNQVGLRKWSIRNFESSIQGFFRQARYFSISSRGLLTISQDKKLSELTEILEAKSKKMKFMKAVRFKIQRQTLIDRIGFKVILLFMIAKGTHLH